MIRIFMKPPQIFVMTAKCIMQFKNAVHFKGRTFRIFTYLTRKNWIMRNIKMLVMITCLQTLYCDPFLFIFVQSTSRSNCFFILLLQISPVGADFHVHISFFVTACFKTVFIMVTNSFTNVLNVVLITVHRW